jgi:hypothetical protein
LYWETNAGRQNVKTIEVFADIVLHGGNDLVSFEDKLRAFSQR